MALAERQIVETVGFDHVGEIEVGSGTLDAGVADVEEVLEARLDIAIGVAQDLGKGVIGLEAQTGAHLVARLELQGVVAGAGIVGQQVGAQRVGILVEADLAIQSVGLEVVAELAHLAGLKVIEDIGIAQHAAGELRKNGQRLAAGDVGIVVGIENAALRESQPAVVLGAQEVRQEAVLVDHHLVEVKGAVGPNHVVAHVARFEERALHLVLDADGILLHVGMFQVGIDHPDGIERVVGVVVGDRQGHLVGGRNDLRQAGRDAIGQAGGGGYALQPGVDLEQGFRSQNLLVVHVTERIAAANRSLAIAEDVPRKAEVGSEILPFAAIPGTARRRACEVQGGIGEQGLLGGALQHGRQFERVGFIHHAGQLVAQAQRHGEVRQQLPLILRVEGVAVVEEVADEGGIGDKSGRSAGDVEGLAIAIHIAAQGCQQRVGGGQIGAAHARQVSGR